MNVVVLKMESIFKKQCIINPSDAGSSSEQGCHFLFVYWDISDCFYKLLMPQNELTVKGAVCSRIVFSNGMASAIVKAIISVRRGK